MIYFIGDSEYVKIGYTKDNPQARLNVLQTGNPRHLLMFAVLRNFDRSYEELLHRRFKRYRRHGEWFERVSAINDLIEWATENPYAIEMPEDFLPLMPSDAEEQYQRDNAKRKHKYNLMRKTAISPKAKRELSEELEWQRKTGKLHVRKMTPEERERFPPKRK